MFQLTSYCAILISTVVAAVLLAGQPLRAEDISDEDILSALSPPRTRSLSVGEPARAATTYSDASFINSVRNKASSSLSADERSKLSALTTGKPQIDLIMEFTYNSDSLKGDSLETAKKLGKALSSPSMKDGTFLIAGHTDAKGGAKINQELSERRAEAVKRFLVSAYQIPPTSLITVGYGKTRLRDTGRPFDKLNRRVQAVNMLQSKIVER